MKTVTFTQKKDKNSPDWSNITLSIGGVVVTGIKSMEIPISMQDLNGFYIEFSQN